jgi:hypothetical protein
MSLAGNSSVQTTIETWGAGESNPRSQKRDLGHPPCLGVRGRYMAAWNFAFIPPQRSDRAGKMTLD